VNVSRSVNAEISAEESGYDVFGTEMGEDGAVSSGESVWRRGGVNGQSDPELRPRERQTLALT